VTTAVLATVGALFSYEAGATQADSTLFKINAAISKTEAANQWNYYQAKSSKPQATTVVQIPIALSAIALLTRRDWLLRGVYVVAAAGSSSARSTVTGAWSEGCGSLRGARSIEQALTAPASAGATSRWSIRRPRFFWKPSWR